VWREMVLMSWLSRGALGNDEIPARFEVAYHVARLSLGATIRLKFVTFDMG
jgi:hypothetical protein